jgi:DNA-directed RNA polymerase specialized sigma24 family protein
MLIPIYRPEITIYDREREVLRGRYVEGLKSAEIARRISRSVKTVERLQAGAMGKIARRLARDRG